MNPLLLPELCCFLRAEHAHTAVMLSAYAQAHSQYDSRFVTRKTLNKAPFGIFSDTKISKDNITFRLACWSNFYSVLQFWIENSEKMNMKYERLTSKFEVQHFFSFIEASERGCVNVLKFFASRVEKARLEAAFGESDFDAFRSAAKNGHVAVLEFFSRQFDQTLLQAAFEVGNFEAFRLCSQIGHQDILEIFCTSV